MRVILGLLFLLASPVFADDSIITKVDKNTIEITVPQEKKNVNVNDFIANKTAEIEDINQQIEDLEKTISDYLNQAEIRKTKKQGLLDQKAKTQHELDTVLGFDSK